MPFKKKKRPSSLRSTSDKLAEPDDESVLDTIQSAQLRRSVLNQEGKKVVRPEDLMKVRAVIGHFPAGATTNSDQCNPNADGITLLR